MDEDATDGGNVIHIGGDNPLDDSWPVPDGEPGSNVVTIGGDPTDLFGEPATDPGDGSNVVSIGGDPTGLFPSSQPGAPGIAIVGGDPTGLFPSAQPGPPGTFIVGGDPSDVFPSPAGDQPAGPQTATIGGDGDLIPPTMDPMIFSVAANTIDMRQAGDAWAELLPGTPLPTAADGTPLPPIEVYFELMQHTQDPATIQVLQARIEAIQARTSSIITGG